MGGHSPRMCAAARSANAAMVSDGIRADRAGHDRSVHDVQSRVGERLAPAVDHAVAGVGAHGHTAQRVHGDDPLEQPQRGVGQAGLQSARRAAACVASTRSK